MKNLLPILVLLMVCLACSFQTKPEINEIKENTSTNTNQTNLTNTNSTNNAPLNESTKPQPVENKQVANKSEPVSHEKLHSDIAEEDLAELEGDDENKREIVKFAKGETSATFENGLVRGERRTYVVEAKKGQTMAVRIEAEEKNAIFNITKNGKIVDTAKETEKWVGTLPSDGKYDVEVSGTRGNASYIIEISVEN
ncbi:MAG: hypothetical protein MUC29_07250 [Pyrinomonadaceae bacterium]|jgi:hypothetical protein|nr:hypothetical protein [Pyrinomonadaceae bacterium]